MVLQFKNSKGVKRKIADVASEKEAIEEISKFLKDKNFKSYYTRSWKPNPYHKVYDVGSWTEFFHLITPCVLVQVDYKGDYERFALTPEEFEERYRKVRPDMPEPAEDDTTYTSRPLVHIWYMMTEVGSAEWCNFFTDMSWGLPKSDIDDGNVAFIKDEEFGELKSVWKEFDKGV